VWLYKHWGYSNSIAITEDISITDDTIAIIENSIEITEDTIAITADTQMHWDYCVCALETCIL
jgi:hypothetical protein